MASYHQCHHLNSHHPTPVATTCCCRRRCCNCTPSHYSPPPPDPLLQSIASHLLHHPPPAPPQPNLHSPHLNPPYTHQTEYQPPQIHKHNQHSGKYRYQEDDEDEQQTLPIVSSLLRRIAALESSLRHHSPAHFSLRDAAARTIQTHFRAFLVRRSRTLRQLKDLAFIKSAFNTLKSSLSDSTHFEYKALSQEAMGLLVKLDSIQGGDPMIRDGKRSISRELIRFMEFVDEVSLKKHVLYSNRVVGGGRNVTKPRVMLGDHRKRTVDSGRSDGDERKLLEELRNRVQKIEEFSRVYEEEEDVGVGNQGVSINGNRNASQNRIGGLVKRQGGVQVQVQPKVKKNVSFVENGNVYRVIRSSHGLGSSGDSDSFDENDLVDGERELMNNLCREVEEIGVSLKETEEDNEEAATEDEESPQVTNEERDPKRNIRNGGDYEIRKQLDQEEDGGFIFSAPLPVKMEARADLMNKKQPVRK